MRVITGSARGRKLVAPQGMDTRPTTDMVKEAIFSIIQFDVPGAKVLDLFAGSGQMGVEALSRGASSVTFVDYAKPAIEAIRQNLEAAGFSQRAKVYPMQAQAFLLNVNERYNIALLDPPYGSGLLQAVLPDVARCMEGQGLIICETRSDEPMPGQFGSCLLHKSYRYGKIKVHVYHNESEEDV